MSIEVMHTNYTRTTHNGDAVPCPRCRRQPLFASRVTRGVPCVDAFCGCEDAGGIIDLGVHRCGETIEAATVAALAEWNEHDHIVRRNFGRDGTPVVIRQSEVRRV